MASESQTAVDAHLLRHRAGLGVVGSAAVVVRSAMVAPAAVLEGLPFAAAYRRALEVSRAATRARLTVPGLLLVAGLGGWLFRSAVEPALGWAGTLRALVFDAAVAALVMAQAAAQSLAYLQRRPPGDQGTVVDPAGVRARLATPPASGRTQPSWLWVVAAAAVLAVPSSLGAAVMADRTRHLARWSITYSDVDGGVRAAGWPAGQYPLVVTGSSVVDCLDDRCDRQARWRDPALPVSSVTIAGDGSLVLASVDPTGDRLRLRRCTRAGACADADVGWPAGPGDRPPLVAATSTTSGGILVATARETTAGMTELTLARCRNLACSEPKQTVLGTVAEPQTSNALAFHRRAPLGVTAEPDTVTYRGRDGSAATPTVCAPACAPAEPTGHGIIAFSANGGFGLRAQAAPPPSQLPGLLGDVAEEIPTEVQFVLAECLQPGCRALGTQWRLNIVYEPVPDVLLTVTPERRTLVVQATDRLVVATTTLPG